MEKGNPRALLPIGVFLLLYLGLGLTFEYVLAIPMGFSEIPIVIAFLAAILVACLQNRKLSFEEKLELMARGVGDKNIFTMLLIFLAAGAFVGVVGRESAESVAYFMLSLIPARFAAAEFQNAARLAVEHVADGVERRKARRCLPAWPGLHRTDGFSGLCDERLPVRLQKGDEICRKVWYNESGRLNRPAAWRRRSTDEKADFRDRSLLQ